VKNLFVDFIGVLTIVLTEKGYGKDGKVTNMIVVELTGDL